MTAEEEPEIPGSGAVYTFGKSRIADNILNHFYIRDDPIVDIACGDEHTIVVCHSGRSFSFGNNNWGQLGLGHKASVKKPNCIKSLKPMKAVHVACGRAHSLVLTDTNQVYTFGNNSDGQLGTGNGEDSDLPKLVEGLTDVKQMSAGCHHSVALTKDGKVLVWGSNGDGQLGLGSEVKSLNKPTDLNFENFVLQIACGYYHTLLLTDDGSVWVFGEGESGKLGLGDDIGRPLPTRLPIAARVIQVSAGGHHTAAVTDEMEVLVWGSNENGQLGLGDVGGASSPTGVPTLTDVPVKAVSCGESHTAFLSVDGELSMCGETRHGKLGLEATNGKTSQRLPVKIQKFANFFVHKVVCGGCHTEVLAAPVKGADGKTTEGSLKARAISESVSTCSSRVSLPPLQKVPPVSTNVYPSQHPPVIPLKPVPSLDSSASSSSFLTGSNSVKERTPKQTDRMASEPGESPARPASSLELVPEEVSFFELVSDRVPKRSKVKRLESALRFYKSRTLFKSLPEIPAEGAYSDASSSSTVSGYFPVPSPSSPVIKDLTDPETCSESSSVGCPSFKTYRRVLTERKKFYEKRRKNGFRTNHPATDDKNTSSEDERKHSDSTPQLCKKSEDTTDDIMEQKEIICRRCTIALESKGQPEGKVSRFFMKMKKSNSQTDNMAAGARNSSTGVNETQKKSKMCIIL